MRIEIDAIIADPAIVEPRTIGTTPGNDNMIETIPEQGIVSQAVQERIIEEVAFLIRILEITVETVIKTEFSSEKIKLMDSLWTINKMKLNESPYKNKKTNIFFNLYIHAVGDSFESQFLVDTGATCSLINFDFLQELMSLIDVKLIESKQKTIAVNGE